MSKIIYITITTILVVCLFCVVNPLVEWIYHFKYTYITLPTSPHILWNDYRLEKAEAMATDRGLLTVIVGVISLLLFFYLRTVFKLNTYKKSSTQILKTELWSIYVDRFVIVLCIITSVCVAFAVFDSLFTVVFDANSSFFVPGILIVLINLFFIPFYIASIGIYDGLKLSTLLKFCIVISLVYAVCFAIGVSPYYIKAIVSTIGAILGSTGLLVEIKGLMTFLGQDKTQIRQDF